MLRLPASALLCGVRGGLFSRRLCDASFCSFRADELDHRHLRRVAAADADFDDPRVAAGSVLEARPDRVEQLSYHGFVLNDGSKLDGARAGSPRLPSVITRSTQRRSSLALGSVVRIFSSRNKRRDKVAH